MDIDSGLCSYALMSVARATRNLPTNGTDWVRNIAAQDIKKLIHDP